MRYLDRISASSHKTYNLGERNYLFSRQEPPAFTDSFGDLKPNPTRLFTLSALPVRTIFREFKEAKNGLAEILVLLHS